MNLTPIIDRCENWANCYRMRMRYSQATSLEGEYRSPQGEHWLFGAAPPRGAPVVDLWDALEINSAWQAMQCGYHAFLLAAWYVRKWSPDKCVREAREFDGRPTPRGMVSDAEFNANIGMCHALLTEQLSLPAVFRRARTAERVRQALDLDVWLASDRIAADPVINA